MGSADESPPPACPASQQGAEPKHASEAPAARRARPTPLIVQLTGSTAWRPPPVAVPCRLTRLWSVAKSTSPSAGIQPAASQLSAAEDQHLTVPDRYDQPAQYRIDGELEV